VSKLKNNLAKDCLNTMQPVGWKKSR